MKLVVNLLVKITWKNFFYFTIIFDSYNNDNNNSTKYPTIYATNVATPPIITIITPPTYHLYIF
jgi:hypothetical protein